MSIADSSAIRTWGRMEALAELYAMLVKAIKKNSGRSDDEEKAVDWMTTVAHRRKIEAAENAGREYVRWAALGVDRYDSLLTRNPSQSELEDFFNDRPMDYNALPGDATEGWCAYRSPSPYQTEYKGYLTNSCLVVCPQCI